jgi:hypothetical protein
VLTKVLCQILYNKINYGIRNELDAKTGRFLSHNLFCCTESDTITVNGTSLSVYNMGQLPIDDAVRACGYMGGELPINPSAALIDALTMTVMNPNESEL